jgi:acyl carrier protein
MEVKMHHIEEEVVKNFKEWQELENETVRLSEDFEEEVG